MKLCCVFKLSLDINGWLAGFAIATLSTVLVFYSGSCGHPLAIEEEKGNYNMAHEAERRIIKYFLVHKLE